MPWLTGMGATYEDARPYVAGWSLEVIAGLIGVAIVVVLGKWLARRKLAAAPQAPAEVSKSTENS
jgi:hypothetical protein